MSPSPVDLVGRHGVPMFFLQVSQFTTVSDLSLRRTSISPGDASGWLFPSHQRPCCVLDSRLPQRGSRWSGTGLWQGSEEDGDGLTRIGWKAFVVPVSLCVQTVSMSSPMQVLPPLPIPCQMSSMFCDCWPQTWIYAPSLPPKKSSHSAVSPWRSVGFQFVITGVRY
jgi:hypothetical protein